LIPASYHDFFSGCATVAGALIGLLFVAISVSPEKLTGDTASIDHQVKAAAAFSALVNALVIALVALLPRVNLGDAGIVLAYAGLISIISLIILQYREHKRRIEPGQALMFVMLFVLYGLQLANSMQLERSPRDLGRVTNEGVLSSSSCSPSSAPGSWSAPGTPACCQLSPGWPSDPRLTALSCRPARRPGTSRSPTRQPAWTSRSSRDARCRSHAAGARADSLSHAAQ
jgi:hypothetical protein